jgi:hypothetical protein
VSWGTPIAFYPGFTDNVSVHGVKRFFHELASDSRIEDPERAFKVNIFYRTIDVAVTQISERFKRLKMVAEKVDFLFPTNFVKLEVTEIEWPSKIVRAYREDCDCVDLERDVRSFQVEFLDELKAEEVSSVASILEIIYRARIASFFPHAIVQIATIILNYSCDISISRKVLLKTESN